MNATPRLALACLLATLSATSCARPAPATSSPSHPGDGGPRSSQDVAATGAIRFPDELHGYWVSVVQACSDDTEAAMRITAEELLGYEEVRRPVYVKPREGHRSAWTIGTELDIGPDDVFEPADPIEFEIVESGQLVSNYKSFADRYRRCEDEQG